MSRMYSTQRITEIHTGFSAKGGGETGDRAGWAAIVEWLSLET